MIILTTAQVNEIYEGIDFMDDEVGIELCIIRDGKYIRASYFNHNGTITHIKEIEA
ncbi:MAG: hypothetical protein ABSF21_00145 [Dehalococcoidia bacterium]|jgi:hypothetical protein